MSERQFLEVRDFALQRGAVLPIAKLGYRTLGKLNPHKDNAVLIPSWITGNDAESGPAFCGPDRTLNPDKYFIILTNLLGAGVSSSPSNTLAPYEKGRFPLVTYYDNVRLQHALVHNHLGIEKLKLVTGNSMGAAQTYQWAAQYPDMVRAAVPMVGAAKTASYNRVFLSSLKKALMLDPGFKDGFYDCPPVAGLKAFAAIYAGWGTSEPFFREKEYEKFGAKDFEDFVQIYWESFALKHDANNILTQISTWEMGDVSDNLIYKGNLDAAFSAIKARVIDITVDHDRYFPPVDAKATVAKISNARSEVINSIYGHIAPFNPADIPKIDSILASALE